MPMSPRLLRPRASGATHPEAASWATRVVTNGGTVGSSTLAAVSKFCRDIDSAGIRDRFVRLNLFCGTGLSACLVPLYRGQSFTGTQLGSETDTNSNFVSGDYTETGATGGLLGNASNKSLSTGVAASNISRGDAHLCYYTTVQPSGGSFRAAMGASAAPAFFINIYQSSDTTPPNANFLSAFFGAATANPLGMVLASETAFNSRRFFVNGVADGAVNTIGNTAGQYSADAITVFTRSGGSHSNPRMAAYSLGLGFSVSQASAYYSALQAFQTALGRNK